MFFRQAFGATFGAANLAAAALLIAGAALPSPALAQTSFTAPGLVEGAGPPLSIGAAAGGIVAQVFVHQGDRVAAGAILFKLECHPLEAEVEARTAHLAAAQATYDRFRNGPRPDEIAVGEAVVGYSKARADEANKALERAQTLQEGITVTTAHLLEVQRDARIAAAQLQEARARLDLLRAGSREEDIRDAKALRDAAAADLEGSRARLAQCSVAAPASGTVLDVDVNPGQFLSLAVPQPLLHIVPEGQARVRSEVALRDLPHLCAGQRASIAAETLPGAAIGAQVASISPAVTARTMATQPGAAAPAGAADNVVAVILTIDQGAPTLPIGLPVTVRFAACPPKS
jgi:multidrug resistance efflux pump